MTDRDLRPEAGGNVDQPDDRRDEKGRLPEPLDSAHVGNPDGPGLPAVDGLPLSQPAGTGPVVSSPVPEPPAGGEEPAELVEDVEPEPAGAKPAKASGLATMPRAQG